MNDQKFRIPNKFPFYQIDNIEKKIETIKSEHPSYSNAINNLFNSLDNKFFSINVSGDQPKSLSPTFPFKPEGYSFSEVPLAVMITNACQFFSNYNEKIQDRNYTVTQYKEYRYEKILLPYILASIIGGYSIDSFIGVNMRYHLGIFYFSFDNTFGENFNLSSFLNNIQKTDYYDILVNHLKICSNEDFLEAFKKEKIDFAYEENGNFVSFQVLKQYDDNTQDKLKDRILSYIEYVGNTTRKELAQYFNKSDRTILYVLEELIKEQKIIRIGAQNSPAAKYTINVK